MLTWPSITGVAVGEAALQGVDSHMRMKVANERTSILQIAQKVKLAAERVTLPLEKKPVH